MSYWYKYIQTLLQVTLIWEYLIPKVLLVINNLFKEPLIPIKINLKLTMCLFLEKNKSSIIVVILMVCIHIYILQITGNFVTTLTFLKIPEAARPLVAAMISAPSNCSESSAHGNLSDHLWVVSNAVSYTAASGRGTDFVYHNHFNIENTLNAKCWSWYTDRCSVLKAEHWKHVFP